MRFASHCVSIQTHTHTHQTRAHLCGSFSREREKNERVRENNKMAYGSLPSFEDDDERRSTSSSSRAQRGERSPDEGQEHEVMIASEVRSSEKTRTTGRKKYVAIAVVGAMCVAGVALFLRSRVHAARDRAPFAVTRCCFSRPGSRWCSTRRADARPISWCVRVLEARRRSLRA